jgi:hypothetical protein
LLLQKAFAKDTSTCAKALPQQDSSTAWARYPAYLPAHTYPSASAHGIIGMFLNWFFMSIHDTFRLRLLNRLFFAGLLWRQDMAVSVQHGTEHDEIATGI